MAPFHHIQDSDNRVRVDWQLMQRGPVTMFRDRAEFDYVVSWLTDHGYVVHTIRATDVASFVTRMSEAIDFPLLFGQKWNGNLDALNDGVGDITFDSETGVVFAFDGYDHVASENYRIAHATLDIIARNSRFHLLTGHLVMALVYSGDPDLSFESLGAHNAVWNNIRWTQAD